ncbi:MAG: biotin--[acetyl-CoA-carboxylase] ligase [Microcoleaceae cyanobacterium]
MILNQQRLEAALQMLQAQDTTETLPVFPQLFETLDSTNQTLWQLMEAGAPAGTVVIAAQQTAGRGQWGRQWQSEPGGLYLSWAIAPNLPTFNPAQLTMCSAWGIATVLGDRQIPIKLKWPNDLILRGRKLGGILTETRVRQGEIVQAVVGVGLNWSNPVPESGINLQTFLAYCPDPATIQSLELVAAIVIQGLNRGWQTLSQLGIEEILPSYSKLLGCRGRRVKIASGVGTIVGITPRGDLCVQLESSSTPDASSDATSSDPTSDFGRLDFVKKVYLKPGTISLGYSQTDRGQQLNS